ncbi:DUF6850 family outer membrane beta-barrel protein [Flavobacterium quisquiliarum]|uniref:DUF6850 family outer membrane beta-barrel protein n=1 Tax=Flavobacterium quisquiliarum TaxID=1834436 RepID=A0ABV8W983_9FLAO|nr:DUF6850 family outer membrane beta-barrel protein [Flavobacterium quisquiliarum]MBW1658297.1 hypothetical protein [Flavobacterium quisquiliarum]NWL02174.1 hypothetical protein [Flavobacterium collinsii]
MKINKIKIYYNKSNAWKSWALLLLLFSFVFTVNAQDTIKVQNHIIDNQIKNQIFKYPIAFTNPDIKDFTFTEVSYEHQQNEFARKQIANEINTYQFLAQGYFTTKSKWKLFGDLAIKKILEKNLGWVLSDDRAEGQEVINPHYFYVPRKADWDNQVYALSGGFSKDITNHLSVAVKANYGTEKFSRTLDARSQIINRNLGGEMQIGYQLTKNHKAFAFGSYAENQKDFNYTYNNANLNLEIYPETYLRFNAGYGRILNSFRNNEGGFTYTYIDQINKLGLGYTFSNKKTIITALYHKQNSNNIFYSSSYTLKSNERLKLKTNSNHAEIFAMHKWNKKEIQSTLQYDQSDSKNFDTKSNGYNYTNSLSKVNWTASLAQKTGSKIDYLVGLNLLYQQNEYDDVLATTHIELNSLNTGIYTSKDFAFAKSKLNATASFNMYFPLPSKLDYYDTSGGTNIRFFDEVILYDYAVNTTNYFAPALRLQYSYPTKNNKTVVFFTNLKEKIALKKQTDYPVSINTNTTYWVQMGVQLNY